VSNPGRPNLGLPGFFYHDAVNNRTLTLVFALSFVTLAAVAATYLILAQPARMGDIAGIEASLGDPPASTTSMLPGGQPQPPVPGDQKIRLPGVPVWSGLLTNDPAHETVVPVGLRVSSIDVDAPIIPTGVNHRTGQMAVPNNVQDVAWYEFGSRPGEDGSAVLAAHVDLANQGPGVFFSLRDINLGDLIEVEFSDGSVSHFGVEARTTYQKDELPVDTIFAKGGSPVLTLITCGGGFSESSGSYDSNVVVYAVPIPDRDLASVRSGGLLPSKMRSGTVRFQYERGDS